MTGVTYSTNFPTVAATQVNATGNGDVFVTNDPYRGGTHLPDVTVIMPAFDDPHDEKARSIVANCFPGRDIMQIEALDIVQGGGGIHCITQQEPAA